MELHWLTWPLSVETGIAKLISPARLADMSLCGFLLLLLAVLVLFLLLHPPRLPSCPSPCWTSTAILCFQCGVRDLKHDLVSSGWHANPQPRSCQKECQTICRKKCQQRCQRELCKICEKECQKICEKKCWKDLSNVSEKMSGRMSKHL